MVAFRRFVAEWVGRRSSAGTLREVRSAIASRVGLALARVAMVAFRRFVAEWVGRRSSAGALREVRSAIASPQNHGQLNPERYVSANISLGPLSYRHGFLGRVSSRRNDVSCPATSPLPS